MSFPRSVLYIPASRPRALDKLQSLSADAFIVDLEDGVAPDEKDAARDAVRHAKEDGILSAERPWMLRINSSGSHWHAADLALAGETRPARIVLPKVERVADVILAGESAARSGARLALTLETALGIGRARELACAHPAVDMLLLGSADLRRSLGASPDAERAWERHALSELLLAARMSGSAAIDSVYFHFRDIEGLGPHAAIARNLGYDGKSCIHPSQIDPIHEVFRSSGEEVAWARRVLLAWKTGDGARRAVVVVDDEMIEALHVEIAERILSRA